jgi:hypothetical protein
MHDAVVAGWIAPHGLTDIPLAWRSGRLVDMTWLYSACVIASLLLHAHSLHVWICAMLAVSFWHFAADHVGVAMAVLLSAVALAPHDWALADLFLVAYLACFHTPLHYAREPLAVAIPCVVLGMVLTPQSTRLVAHMRRTNATTPLAAVVGGVIVAHCGFPPWLRLTK